LTVALAWPHTPPPSDSENCVSPLIEKEGYLNARCSNNNICHLQYPRLASFVSIEELKSRLLFSVFISLFFCLSPFSPYRITMAPSINDLPAEFTGRKAFHEHLSHNKKFIFSAISSSSSEIDSAEHSEDDCDCESTTTATTNFEAAEPELQYTSKKLLEAQRRVEHDFRSDVVTVPVDSMMKV